MHQMDSEANEQQPKQERLRTRWTASLDRVFADLVVQQIQLGNRPNNVFDKKTWNHIRDEFNKQTSLNFNNNQLRKHLDVLRARFHNLKSSFDQQDPVEDSCYIGFDLWEDIGAQQKPPEMGKIKECPIYDQLFMIFADSGADGKYAQSSHYEELDKSVSVDPSCLEGDAGSIQPQTPNASKIIGEIAYCPQNTMKNIAERKRKRLAESVSGPGESNLDQKLRDTMAQTMFEMIAASKLQTVTTSKYDERFTITNCIKALDEIEGIEDWLYYSALDLFENPSVREIFVSLQSSIIRLTWLRGKCCQSYPIV